MKVKANAVKQEYEKQDELKRSALRALASLAAIPKAGKLLLIAPKKLLNSSNEGCVFNGYALNIFNCF